MDQGFKNRRAMTLVETLLCAALLPMIMGACFILLRTGWDSWAESSAETQLSQGLSQSIAWLTGDLRQSGPSVIGNVPADNAWHSSITFAMAQDASVIGTIWGPLVTYVLGGPNGDQLIRTQNSQPQTIAANITSIQFKRQSACPDIINIQIRSAVPTYRADEKLTLTLNTKVFLRN
jgi:hypothetical protein